MTARDPNCSKTSRTALVTGLGWSDGNHAFEVVVEGSELKDVEVLVGVAVIDPTVERPLKARLADDAEWRKLALSSFGVMYQGGKVSDWAGGGFEFGCEALHVEVDISSATLTLAKGSVGAGEAWAAATASTAEASTADTSVCQCELLPRRISDMQPSSLSVYGAIRGAQTNCQFSG